MATSAKKITSNRANSKKSTGPKDTSSTRLNALRHGLCAAGFTDLDDVQLYRTTMSDLVREQAPVVALEAFLVGTLAFEMVMWRRARRLQAEYIMSALHLPRREKDIVGDLITDFEGKILDPGLPAAINPISMEQVVAQYERYTSGISNRFFRTLHSLERSQRIRQGENVPAPVAVDVSVVAETVARESAHSEPQQASPVPMEEGEPAAAPAIGDIVDITDAATGVVDSPPTDSEHEGVLPADGEHFAAPNTVDVAEGETGNVHSASTTWSPRDRSRPLWNDR